MTEQHGVWFNSEQKGLYEDLKGQGLIAEEWPEFVRSAYYNKINGIIRQMSKK